MKLSRSFWSIDVLVFYSGRSSSAAFIHQGSPIDKPHYIALMQSLSCFLYALFCSPRSQYVHFRQSHVCGYTHMAMHERAVFEQHDNQISGATRAQWFMSWPPNLQLPQVVGVHQMLHGILAASNWESSTSLGFEIRIRIVMQTA